MRLPQGGVVSVGVSLGLCEYFRGISRVSRVSLGSKGVSLRSIGVSLCE